MGSKKQLDKVVEKDYPELLCIKVPSPAQEDSGLETVKKMGIYLYHWHPKPIFLYSINQCQRQDTELAGGLV